MHPSFPWGPFPCPAHLSVGISHQFPEGSFPSYPTPLWGSLPAHSPLCHWIIPSQYSLFQETIPYPLTFRVGSFIGHPITTKRSFLTHPTFPKRPFPALPTFCKGPFPSHSLFPKAPFPPFPGPSVDPLVVLQLPLEFFLLLLEPLLHLPLPSRCIHRLGPPEDGSSPAGLGSRSC